jgi:methionyl-tRNA formyltransferase
MNTGLRHFIFKTSVYGVFRLWNACMATLGIRKWTSSTRKLVKWLSINSYSTANINEPAFVSAMRDLAPDLIISVSMNQIVKPELLSIPPKGCINVHCSPLPRYGGMSPYVWILANGDDHSAATIHYMEEGLDVGDILLQEKMPVVPKDSAFHLFWRCCCRAGELLEETVQAIASGTQTSYPQDMSQKTYYSWPTKEAIAKLRSGGYRLARVSDFLQAMFGGRPRSH